MARIPAGAFLMGDAGNNGNKDEGPRHSVTLDSFDIDRCEVSNAQMGDMLQWAYTRGLVRLNSNGVLNTAGAPRLLFYIHDWNAEVEFRDGQFIAAAGREAFPCIEVTWYGAMAYCNFRSMREQLPISVDFVYWQCVFDRPGYRLPSEAEWEKAARGGLAGHVFPWPGRHDEYHLNVKKTFANFWKSGDANEGVADYTYTTPIGYYHGALHESGGSMTNGYGLYDMAGNVEEWCWDLYGRHWYRQKQAKQRNCTGPQRGVERVVRGGSWLSGQKMEMKNRPESTWSYHLRVADRESRSPGRGQHFRGFRCVRPVKE